MTGWNDASSSCYSAVLQSRALPAHILSIDLLRKAFGSNDVEGLRGAPRARRLEDLHGRVHRGAYRALPSRRVYKPKPDGRQRPLAVAALEDKILQRAVVTLLNAIYEFLGISHGFRPGRGTHDALDALCVGIGRMKVSFILDADIRSLFDESPVPLSLTDTAPSFIRLVQKWLKAGILAGIGDLAVTCQHRSARVDPLPGTPDRRSTHLTQRTDRGIGTHGSFRSSLARIAQTWLGCRGGFGPVILPLFQAGRETPAAELISVMVVSFVQSSETSQPTQNQSANRSYPSRHGYSRGCSGRNLTQLSPPPFCGSAAQQ